MSEPTDLDRMRQEYADRKARLAGSDRYSYLNPAYLFAMQQRQRNVLSLLHEKGISSFDSLRLLEVGCGSGGVLLEFLMLGASPGHANGVDLMPDRVIEAHARLPHLPLVCADGQNLPYRNDQFDLIIQYTAFSSILDHQIKIRIAQEMVRVLRKSNGLLLWYDFWLNPTNRQTAGIRPGEIRMLFPGCRFNFRRVTLAPPLARWVVPVSWGLAGLLEKFVFFNSHYLVVIQP